MTIRLLSAKRVGDDLAAGSIAAEDNPSICTASFLHLDDPGLSVPISGTAHQRSRLLLGDLARRAGIAGR